MKFLSSPLMTVLRRPLGALALAILCMAGLSACADGDTPRDNTAMLPADQQVSSLPWNRQAGWENTSKLGSLANDPRIGGHQ